MGKIAIQMSLIHVRCIRGLLQLLINPPVIDQNGARKLTSTNAPLMDQKEQLKVYYATSSIHITNYINDPCRAENIQDLSVKTLDYMLCEM